MMKYVQLTVLLLVAGVLMYADTPVVRDWLNNNLSDQEAIKANVMTVAGIMSVLFAIVFSLVFWSSNAQSKRIVREQKQRISDFRRTIRT